MTEPDGQRTPEQQRERELGVALFNATWDLLDQPQRTADEDDRMLHRAHASRYHWGEAAPAPQNLGRGEWLCSRVYAVLGRPEPALHHARRTLQLCEQHGLGDFDLAFAYEALARAHAVAGNAPQARDFAERARSSAADIAADDDRALLLADLATIAMPPD